jgi:hypothetical protein
LTAIIVAVPTLEDLDDVRGGAGAIGGDPAFIVSA